jgi:two-component system, response regulator / RNA-binding antiterminator
MVSDLHKGLRIMLVDDSPERAAQIEEALTRNGYRLVAHVSPDLELYRRVREIEPDVIIIDTDSPNRDTIEHICCITHNSPRPIVMVTNDTDSHTIRAAVKAGVTAYVVDGLSANRLRPILEVAIAQFEECHAMRCELEQAKLTLAERKLIERAKGVVMRQRRLDEETAYKSMRKMPWTATYAWRNWPRVSSRRRSWWDRKRRRVGCAARTTQVRKWVNGARCDPY